MDSYGFGGIHLYALGLTGATATNTVPNYTIFQGGSTASVVDAYDGFSAGFAVKNFGSNVIGHVFRARTNTIDFELQAGDTVATIVGNKTPQMRLSSNGVYLRDFSDDKGISIYRLSGTTPYNVAEVFAKNQTISPTNGVGIVAIQSRAGVTIPGFGHGYGSVFIGATAVNAGIVPLYPTNSSIEASALNIERTSVNNLKDGHLTLWNRNISSLDQFNLKITGIPNTGGWNMIGSGRVGFTSRQNIATETALSSYVNQFVTASGQTLTALTPRFNFHVNPVYDQATLPNGHYRFGSQGALARGITKWIAGFDAIGSNRVEDGGGDLVNLSIGAGLGVGYAAEGSSVVAYNDFKEYWKDIILNTYYTGDISLNTQNDYLLAKVNPSMYMQVGNESTSGNVGIGFASNFYKTSPITWWPGTYEARAKLSVAGSVRIGSTSNGYHNITTTHPNNGMLVEGQIIRGATSIYDVLGTQFAVGHTAIANAIFGGNLNLITGPTGDYGIASLNRTFSKSFLATGPTSLGRNNATEPHFALPDWRSGMRLQTQGDAYLTTIGTDGGATGATGVINQSVWTDDVFRFAFAKDATPHATTGMGTVYPNASAQVARGGVQAQGSIATKPLVLTGTAVGNLCTPNFAGGSPVSDPDGTYNQPNLILKIPSTNSSVVFVGNGNVKIGTNVWGWDRYANGGVRPLNGYWAYIEPGSYEGQLLTITSMGWLPDNGIIINNNPRYNTVTGTAVQAGATYGDYHMLQLEFTGAVNALNGNQGYTGGQGSISDWNTDFLNDAPYPFPYGAMTPYGFTPGSSNDKVFGNSLWRSNWSKNGQFTIRDFRTITLQWLPFYDLGNYSNVQSPPVAWRWVEISRTNLNYTYLYRSAGGALDPIR
jgi:hypothetical protein